MRRALARLARVAEPLVAPFRIAVIGMSRAPKLYYFAPSRVSCVVSPVETFTT